MADNKENEKKILEEIKKLSGDIANAYREQLKALNAVNADTKTYENLLNDVQKTIENINEGVGDLSNKFSKTVQSIREANAGLGLTQKSFTQLNSIASSLQSHQQGSNTLTSQELKNLQSKLSLEQVRLQVALNTLRSEAAGLQGNAELLAKNRKAQEAINKAINDQNNGLKELNKQLKDAEDKAKKQENTFALSGSILNQFGGTLRNIGINTETASLAAQKYALEAGNGATKMGALNATLKNIGGQMVSNLTNPLMIAGFLLKQIVDTFLSVDKATGELAKNFNKSYTEAAKMRNELTGIANRSMDVAVTTKGLQESMVAIGQALGVNAQLNEKDLVTFTKLREQAGFTNQELVGMQRATLAQGGTLEDNAKKFLGTVEKMNAQNKLSINAKQLLKEVANVSDAIRLSVGGTVEKLAEAAFKAKQFGINLQQADQIASQLLNFEQSLSNELSAELITGKNLNFERARLLAINGDIAGASAEILKQVGGTAEFTKMNRIQQEAIAKAVGMSREDLAKSLTDREAAARLGAKEGQSAQARYNELVKIHGVEKANKILGDEALANQFQQQSVQERFANAVEKLKEVFVSLVTPLLPVLDIFAQIFKIVGPIAGVIGTILGYVGKLVSFFSPLLTAMLTWKLLTGSVGKGIMSVGKSMLSIFTTQGRINLLKKTGIASDQIELLLTKQKEIAEGKSLMTAKMQDYYKNKTVASTIKDNILAKASNALKLVGINLDRASNASKTAGLGIQKAGNRSAGKGLLSKAGEFILGMFSAGAKAPFPLNLVLPFTLGAIAGGIAGAMIGKYMKGDDVMSESGYGNRTLLTPKGSIALNNEDTVIAGTNLFPSKKGDDVVSSPKGSINMAPPSQPQVINNSTILEFEGRALQTVANRQHRISNKP